MVGAVIIYIPEKSLIVGAVIIYIPEKSLIVGAVIIYIPEKSLMVRAVTIYIPEKSLMIMAKKKAAGLTDQSLRTAAGHYCSPDNANMVKVGKQPMTYSYTRTPRNAVSRLPALSHKKEVNLKSLPFLRNKS